jgi:uncharacterized protein DUF4159
VKRTAAVIAIAALVAATASAQRGGRFGGGRGAPIEPNARYDGQFTFVRLRYGPPIEYQSQRVAWSHDYPAGERHFMKILNEISYLGPKTAESNIMALDDPELFKYPLAYMAEPGRWVMTDAEAAGFRQYLLKGGFVVFDDFRRYDWENFETQMRRVLPEARFFDLDASSPVFHSFFEIGDLDIVPQYYDSGKPIFRGIFEDNDPTKRLMVMINYNTDISEFWEWSDTGFKPIDESNEAYKLGVNYFLYGLTH